MAALSVNIDVPSTEIKCNNIIKAFFKSKKNSNCVLELEEMLLSNDEGTVLTSINVAADLFHQILYKNMLVEVPSTEHDDAHRKYRSWLTDRYQDFTEHLLEYLQSNNVEIQEAAFSALMKFVQAEGENPFKLSHKYTWHFPFELFKKITSELASNIIDHQHLISKMQEYASHDDIKINILEVILSLLDKRVEVTDIFLRNCFLLLCTVQYPKKFFKDGSNIEINTYLSQKDIQTPYYLKEKAFKGVFSSAWYQFLKYELPVPLYRKVLIALHKRVLPYVNNPCLLTDFLTESYNKGGITSLLALNSLFFLMEKYNVEYPDFFQKLYALFSEDIINSKFSARFFTLANLFLSSTHLPAYIVASFIKRLSRLALCSKTSTILVIIGFISNLLIRHPMLKTLIHRPDSADISSDPYDACEVDPSKSNAVESSLWEIKSLQNHMNPDVSRKAKIINKDLPKIVADLSSLVDLTAYDLYQKERRREFKEVPMAIQKPSSTETWWLL